AGGETAEVTIEGREDPAWPQATRGMLFTTDRRLEKADSLGQALGLGVKRTARLIYRIYQSLAAMLDGTVSFSKNASGPVEIFKTSYEIAGENMQMFVLFLGMISVN